MYFEKKAGLIKETDFLKKINRNEKANHPKMF